MARDAIKELVGLFYDSLINDNDKWTKTIKTSHCGSFIEYESPTYNNMRFSYCKYGLCYIYIDSINKQYKFNPRMFNFKKHIRKIDKRHESKSHEDILKEIDVYKWYKESN